MRTYSVGVSVKLLILPRLWYFRYFRNKNNHKKKVGFWSICNIKHFKLVVVVLHQKAGLKLKGKNSKENKVPSMEVCLVPHLTWEVGSVLRELVLDNREVKSEDKYLSLLPRKAKWKKWLEIEKWKWNKNDWKLRSRSESEMKNFEIEIEKWNFSRIF